MIETPLRERSKLRRKRAIQRAAMRLFAERGYDAATVADIAAEAEVAPRTVSMYFPTKIDIALSSINEAAGRLTTALEKHDPGSSIVQTIADWFSSEAQLLDEEERRLRAAMFAANPSLSAVGTTHTEAASRIGARLLAAELGVPVDHFTVRLTLGAIGGVFLQYELLPTKFDDHDAVLEVVRALLDGAVKAAKDQVRQIG